MSMTTPTKIPWYYHSFDEHNDRTWRDYWIGGEEFDREFGFGGFTLYFNPEVRVVGISLCSLKDRFDKRIGRKVAEEITQGFLATTDHWYVLCPTIETCSLWTALMLRNSKAIALHTLSYMYPHTTICFYTPRGRSKEAIWQRHIDNATEKRV